MVSEPSPSVLPSNTRRHCKTFSAPQRPFRPSWPGRSGLEDNMQQPGQPVLLHVYDLSSGLAAQLSKALLGKQIDGVWHTGIVVNGLEYYYGAGIQCAPAGSTPFGTPIKTINLGSTQIPQEVFQEYMADLHGIWRPEAYSLFANNCNHFTDEVASFLTGTGIPAHITELPREVLSTPFGQMIAPGLGGMQGRLNNTQQGGQTAIEQTPFKPAPGDVTAAVTDSLRTATAAVVADMGIPLDTASTKQLAPQQKEEGMKKLAEASAALNDNRQAVAEVASGLGRTSIGREHREQVGTSVASTMGFPAPVSRRLTTARSGEIITRLGSGHGLPVQSQPSFRASVELRQAPLPEPRRALVSPREPKDGTKAQPGPSHAKIAGLNVGVAYTLERSSNGRPASAKAAFESTVRKEFNRLMAEGGCSPNEAAAQAIRRAAAVHPSAA